MKIEVDNMFYRTATKEGGWHSLQTSTAGGYERHIEEGKTRHLYYISGADGMVAICKKEDNNKQFYYVHKDHLGSPHVITDENKEVQARYYYDVWGHRYFVNKENGNELSGQNDLSWMQRGVTGHEHIKELDLINMNGRMFDPLLGRFLSPDPYVQSPDRTKNFNRYAYAMNNPLVFEDPNGESITLAIAAIAGAYFGGVTTNNGNFNPLDWDYGSADTYLGMTVGAISGYAGASVGMSVGASAASAGATSFEAGFAAGAMGGMVSGGINGAGMTAIAGGDFDDIMGSMIKGSVMGAWSGALSGGVSAGIGKFTGVEGSGFKNAMYELGHSALKGGATGLAGGAMMAAMNQDASYLWKGAAIGAGFSAGMAGLKIGLMGTTIVPKNVNKRFAMDDRVYGINRYNRPCYRRGGLLKHFTPAITIGNNMMVDVKYKKFDPAWYRFTLAHERAHIYQQMEMGTFNFYKRILKEYIINPGYSLELYTDSNYLDYWADQYAKFTP